MKKIENNLTKVERTKIEKSLKKENNDRFLGNSCYLCLNCSNSFSTDNDELVCVVSDEPTFVDEDYVCIKWI